MKQDGSIALFQYWNGLRAGRSAPAHTEIDPAAIKSVLSDTFILERRPRGTAQFRLAGTRVCAIFGRELRGVSFASLWGSEARPQVDRIVEGVFATGSVLVASFEGTTQGGRSTPFEMIVLPLDVAHGQAPRCLGLVTSVDKPFWLGADAIVGGTFGTLGVIDPARTAFRPGRAAIGVPALSPLELPASEEFSRPKGARRVRHLVVLDGGRRK
jgi:hypothetical protein